MGRRAALGLLGGAAGAAFGSVAGAQAQAANQWFAVTSDDGRPVPNMRVPVELAEEIHDLPGLVWGGPPSAPVTLVEFYDYNCPWCRGAAGDLTTLMRGRDLRVGLVNNPILSPGSVGAAKVELATLKLRGADAAHRLFETLYAFQGRIDGTRALDAASAIGLDRAEVERVANSAETAANLKRQTRLAADLGLVATPSYVIGGAAILGYPGPDSLGRIVANARGCGTISC